MENAMKSDRDEQALGYRPEIDSLRALAIIPVVIFHLNASLLRGGYLGVDVFFVLSGYLISKILLRDIQRGSFRIGHFYSRRIRRLLPVILSVVTVTLLVATVYLSDSQRVYVAQQSVAALASVSNLFVWQSTGDYWGPTAEGTALLHTWSLSVEEQFYLIYPVVLALVYRRSPRSVTAFLAFVIFTSGITYWVVTAASPNAAFFLLPTRAWELACGGLLASVQFHASSAQDSRRQFFSQTCVMRSGLGCLVGMALMLVAYWYPSGSRSNELGVMIAVAGAMLFLASSKSNPVFRWLSLPPLVYVGRVSYSWYMWHWPMFVLNDLAGFYIGRVWLGIASFLAAVVSYHLIEQTTRRRKGILKWIFASFVSVMAFAGLSMIPRPITPVDPTLFEATRWYGNYYNAAPTDVSNDWYERIVSNVQVPQRFEIGDEFEREGIRLGVGGASGEAPDVVLLGDSHATMWAHLIHRLTEQRGRSLSVWAINGMDPTFASEAEEGDPESIKSRYDAARKRKLMEWKPILSIISIRWSQRDPVRSRRFVEFVASCSENVLLVGTTPELRIGDESVRNLLVERGIAPAERQRKYLPRVLSDAMLNASSLAKDLASKIPNVHYLEIGGRFENESNALVLVDRHCVFLDDDHLTDFGTFLAKPDFEKALDRILPPKEDQM
jgi:peptidoglycan/LPS O-acetylase OafA/YrhL